MQGGRILYLSYDGLTDPLGQSQILPYLTGLSKRGFVFTVLSFEKREKYASGKLRIQRICDANGIRWVPLFFTPKPPILSKIYDLLKFRRAAQKLQRAHRYQLVHARSYVAADVALKLKRKFGVPWIFDMRGFWVDERIEGSIWNLQYFSYRLVYRAYRKKEGAFLKQADHIVSLTEAGKAEIMHGLMPKMHHYDGNNWSNRISVIPCAADLELFAPVHENERETAKKKLGLENETVLTYLGSLGTWYMLREMLDCFRVLQTYHGNLLFQFITPEPPEMVFEKAGETGLQKDNIRIVFAQRNELRTYLAATDIGISFMRPAFSRKATSPVKFGEMQCMGIPMIVNAGTGDMEAQIRHFDGGMVLEQTNDLEYHKAGAYIRELDGLDRNNISMKAATSFGLANALLCYESIYKQCFRLSGP